MMRTSVRLGVADVVQLDPFGKKSLSAVVAFENASDRLISTSPVLRTWDGTIFYPRSDSGSPSVTR